MKKSLTLFSIMLASIFCSLAQIAPVNDLTIFSEQGEAFYVVVNGVRQNNLPQTNVKVRGLNLPNYKVKIIFADNELGELDKNILMPAEPAEVVYNIRKGKDGAYVLRFNSAVPIPVSPPPPAPDQTVVVYSSTPTPPPPPPAPVPASSTTVVQTTTTQTPTNVASIGMSVDGMNVGMSINVNDPFMEGTSTTTTTTTRSHTVTTGSTQVVPAPAPTPPPPPAFIPGYNGRIGCNGYPMDPSSFSSAKEAIEDASFEDTKMSTAKSIINGQCLSTDQVIQICQMFDFEASKLAFAKHAYRNTVDVGNYFKVNKVFDFDASKTDLNNYVNSMR